MGQETIDTEKMDKLKQMDIAKPPTKQIGFVEYPKVVHLHPKDKSQESIGKSVANKEEEEAALAAGYRLKPHIPVIPEPLPEGFEADNDTEDVPEESPKPKAKKGKKAEADNDTEGNSQTAE